MISTRMKWLHRGDRHPKSVGFGSRGGPSAHSHGFEPQALALPAAVGRGDRGARTVALSWNSLRVRCVLVRKICGTAWSACATVMHLCLSAHIFVEDRRRCSSRARGAPLQAFPGCERCREAPSTSRTLARQGRSHLGHSRGRTVFPLDRRVVRAQHDEGVQHNESKSKIVRHEAHF